MINMNPNLTCSAANSSGDSGGGCGVDLWRLVIKFTVLVVVVLIVLVVGDDMAV
jgi:hypothetical protein